MDYFRWKVADYVRCFYFNFYIVLDCYRHFGSSSQPLDNLVNINYGMKNEIEIVN